MVRSNPHTHSDLVDGKSTAREQVLKALELGFVSLGFSEHAHQAEIDVQYGLKSELRPEYIDQIRSLQCEFSDRLKIWLGFEVDRVSDEDCEGADYFIGASHYFTDSNGEFAGVDGDDQKLAAFVASHFSGSWDKAVECYYDEYAQYICRRPPTIIAHFDLICKSNRRLHWFDEDGMNLKAGMAAMERMIKYCDLMEVNTGGMARSNQPFPYPSPKLLAHWKKLGGRVIPSSDCHRYWQLDAGFNMVEEYMREAGFTEYFALGSGSQLFEAQRL